MSEIEVANSGHVSEGTVYVAAAGGHSIALTRIAGTVHAFENKCPHFGLALARGKIENGAITCPWHGSKFDICSGKNLDWVNSFVGIPMPDWTHNLIAMGKKPVGLTTFKTIEKDGAIFVEI